METIVSGEQLAQDSDEQREAVAKELVSYERWQIWRDSDWRSSEVLSYDC